MAEPGRNSGRTQGIAGTWPPRGAAQAGGYAPTGFSVWPSFIEMMMGPYSVPQCTKTAGEVFQAARSRFGDYACMDLVIHGH